MRAVISCAAGDEPIRQDPAADYDMYGNHDIMANKAYSSPQ